MIQHCPNKKKWTEQFLQYPFYTFLLSPAAKILLLLHENKEVHIPGRTFPKLNKKE